MPKGYKNFFHGWIYFFSWNGYGQEICKSKLQQKVGGPQPQQLIQKVGIHNLFENTYVWSKGVIHIQFP